VVEVLDVVDEVPLDGSDEVVVVCQPDFRVVITLVDDTESPG